MSKPQGTGGLIGRLAGEMSKLRKVASSIISRTGRWGSVYKVDSTHVDYEKARQLYDNSLDAYKLGAWAAKPVINTAVGFMGVPAFKAEDEKAQEVLDSFHAENVSRFQQTLRDAMRDGDCDVWITREESEESRLLYPESKGVRLVYNIIPPEQIQYIRRNPLTGEAEEYVLKSEHDWIDEAGNKKRFRITQTVNATERIIRYEGEVPPHIDDLEVTKENKWGFLPIVRFSNEKDASALNGRSDLESIEPFMKAYHDVMCQAIQAHKIHSNPKIKLKVKDMTSWLQKNFGIKDINKFIEQGGTINLEGHDFLMFDAGAEEDMDFVEVRSATGDADKLLKFLFYCMVDVSETPEFAFGVHTPSSQASVKEQMPILIRRISRKREHFTQPFQKLARMVLAMTAKAGATSFLSYATELLWDEIDPRDDKDIADALKITCEGLKVAVQTEIMSHEAAAEYLRKFVDTMTDWVGDKENAGERLKIIRERLRQARLEDSDLAMQEDDIIQRILKELDAA